MSAIDIREIVTGLASRMPALCRDLFPAGRREGPEFRVGNLAGDPGRSLAVRLEGARAGIWCDFASGEKGDALDLVAQAGCGGDKAGAVAWAKSWLGLDGERAQPRAKVARSSATTLRAATASREAENRNREGAFRLWLGAQERLAGTPADRYLKGRGIDLEALHRQPRALRFTPELAHAPTNTRWPALVAAINGPDGGFAAIHRTYLAPAAGGRYAKAPVNDPKMTLGRYAGGCIRLWRGASGRNLDAASAGEEIVVTEGIEDGLTVAIACPERRVLVAVSLANMGAMRLPATVAGIIVCAHNDDAIEARRALDRAIARWRGEGRRVRLARPPAGVKDLNELRQRRIEGAA